MIDGAIEKGGMSLTDEEKSDFYFPKGFLICVLWPRSINAG